MRRSGDCGEHARKNTDGTIDRPVATRITPGGRLRSWWIYRGRPGRARRLREHYAPFVPSGGLAFDVGAHVGDRTRAFAALGARVVAVEPHPGLIPGLRRLSRRWTRVSVVGATLGATVGQDVLYTCPANPTVTTVSRDWVRRASSQPGWETVTFSGPPVSVERTTLDALVADHGVPDFIKIDVEGVEDEVLAGLTTPVEAVSIEFLPPDRDVALRAVLRLEALGSYEYNVSLGESLRLVMKDRWWRAPELQNYLREIPDTGPSGDIYARRIN